jgi:transposase
MKKAVKSPQEVSVRQELRYFSEASRKAIVEEIEGGISKAEAARKYKVSQASIYKWLWKYSSRYEKPLRKVVEHESDSIRANKLEQELKEVYQALGKSELKCQFLETVLQKAKEELNLDLKKNFGT